MNAPRKDNGAPVKKKQKIETITTNDKNDNNIRCAACDVVKDVGYFTKSQLSKRPHSQRCKICVENCKEVTSRNRETGSRMKEKQIKEKKRKKVQTDAQTLARNNEAISLKMKKKQTKEKKSKKASEETKHRKRRQEKRIRLEKERKMIEKQNRDRIGIGFYENLCQESIQVDADDIDKEKQLQFKPDIHIKREDLIAKYDILYVAFQSNEGNLMSRTTKGTLRLSWRGITTDKSNDDDGSKEEIVLRGTVKLDPEQTKQTGASMLFPYYNFEFEELVEKSDKDEPATKADDCCSIPCKVTTEDDFGEIGCPLKIKIISKRDAIGRRGTEDYLDTGESMEDHICIEKHHHDVNFDTLEEAEELDKIARIGEHCYNSWLCHHKSLPAPVAKIIYDYVRYKPKPVFFIEEGDIHLGVAWYDSFPGFCHMVMLARRRC